MHPGPFLRCLIAFAAVAAGSLALRSVRAAEAPGLKITKVEPTVFFTQRSGKLHQCVDLTVDSVQSHEKGAVTVRSNSTDTSLPVGPIAAGTHRCRIQVPAIESPGRLTFHVTANGRQSEAYSVDWQPQRRWEVHMVHGSHHDLGYTDIPSNVLREHDGYLDQVLDFCRQTADWPEEARFRYVIEQGWSAKHYIENRPREKVEQLVAWMREGRIELTALLGNETSELCGHEEQVRLLYPAFAMKRRYGIPVRSAELNDIPGVSWGLASVLAGSGVRWFAPAIPDYFAWGKKVRFCWDEEQVLPRNMPGAFWWEGPDGNRVLFWYPGGSVGGPWLGTYEQAEKNLPAYLSKLAHGGYAFDLVRLKFHGGLRDNSPPDIRLSRIVRDWNQRWAWPRLVVSTNARFFERFEQRAGKDLKVLRGELPNTDYTVGAASTARPTGVSRLTHDLLPTAEKFAVWAALLGGYEYPADTLREAYECLLMYDEHSWGMAHPIGPAQEACFSQKQEFAYRAAALAHDVLYKSTNRIADRVQLTDAGSHIVVFNPLTVRRTDVAVVPAHGPEPCGRPQYWRGGRGGVLGASTVLGRREVHLSAEVLNKPFELIDLAAGRSVPCQVVRVQDPLAARPYAAERYAMGHVSPTSVGHLNYGENQLLDLVFVAEDVPPLGFKTHRLAPVQRAPTVETSLQLGDHALENRFYNVRLDPQTGTIASIVEKETGRQWVDLKAAHRMNQLLVRSARTGETSVPEQPKLSRGEQGPVAASLVVRGQATGCPQVVQEITLYDRLKRIDLATRVLKDATAHLEYYLAFPFEIQRPQFLMEASNSVIALLRDQLPGSNTDTYTVQHWVDVGDDRDGVAWCSLETSLVKLAELWPGCVSQAHHGATPRVYAQDFLRSPEQFRRGHLYSYLMATNFRTNFAPVQVADCLFRYSLTTRRQGAPASVARDLGWSAANPLVGALVNGPREGILPVAASLCQIDKPNVLLLALKKAEDGEGIILRLAECEGVKTTAEVALPGLRIQSALVTNLVEEDQRPLAHGPQSVQVPLSPHGLATIRCHVVKGETAPFGRERSAGE